jgi:LysM repeat protein
LATYTVKNGDTLSEIAEKYKPSGTSTYDYVDTLVKWNDISNPDKIYVGQVLTVTNGTTKNKTNNSNKAIILQFGELASTPGTIFATWKWTKSNTENYEIQWQYYDSKAGWLSGNKGTTDIKESTYSMPSGAVKVRFRVKPISKKRTVNNKETSYWTATWSSYVTFNKTSLKPSTPSTPSLEVDNLQATVSVDNIETDVNATHIQFRIVKNDTGTVYTSPEILLKNKFASYIFKIEAGHEYKATCRAYNSKGRTYSDWASWSSSQTTIPGAPKSITKLYAYSNNQIYIEWSTVKTAESYEVQYTTKKDYFDTASSEVTSVTTQEVSQTKMILSIDVGDEYFFRVRAINSAGESSWTSIKSCTIGKKPAAPTTWSSTSNAIVGEPVTLYWMHNSVDGSSKQYSELLISTNAEEINGSKVIGGEYRCRFDHTKDEEDEWDKPGTFTIDTTGYNEGFKMEWKVKTAGVFMNNVTKEPIYSDWSITRKIDVWAPPTLSISMTDSTETTIDTLTTFPFYISGVAGPTTQKPICYHVNITANEGYETVDDVGNKKIISVGDSVYSKLFDTNENLIIMLSAHNIDLENNISYTVTVEVTMDSGLSTQASLEFTVAWEDKEYSPNAEVYINYDNLSASIRPFCEDENGELLDGIILSVYRREFDGTFTEIGSDISNLSYTFITDPHPALDYARYRIVAKTESTGAVSYYDLPGYPVGEKAVIIQWDEEWRSFDVTSDDTAAEEREQPTWTGSLLKLPYNVDVSDSYSPDVAHVKYIGRRHPVSYYGTQIGSTSSWNVEIDKQDTETLYALRRLAIWMDNVYVREPSGSGYWANIKLQFPQKHCELTIPVSIDVTRVEGGI